MASLSIVLTFPPESPMDFAGCKYTSGTAAGPDAVYFLLYSQMRQKATEMCAVLVKRGEIEKHWEILPLWKRGNLYPALLFLSLGIRRQIPRITGRMARAGNQVLAAPLPENPEPEKNSEPEASPLLAAFFFKTLPMLLPGLHLKA